MHRRMFKSSYNLQREGRQSIDSQASIQQMNQSEIGFAKSANTSMINGFFPRKES